MPDDTTSKTNRAAPTKLRRAGLIFRITSVVFALTGIIYAVNVYRHDSADFDISMSVLQFSLGIVFFLIGAACYRKADAEYHVQTSDSFPHGTS